MAASPQAPTVGAPLYRGWPCASSRLAMNKNEHTLKHTFPSITGINEQPFTRTLTIKIPKQINNITIRAYDLIHEFGGKEITLEINKEN